MRAYARALTCCVVTVLWLAQAPAGAWGPHPAITKAALDVLAHSEQAREVLGAEFDQLPNYAWMPDTRGQDFPAYYPDDYLLIRAFPTHAGHAMPGVAETYEPYFRRALQALRTETPMNACRQIGALIHFVEDSGAPPHARPISEHHGPLENWVKAGEIDIEGYSPQLLGADDDAAVAGLEKRMEELVAFSILRADRALPLVQSGEAGREEVEPIILESALESARAAADVLHTLFSLALAPGEDSATLRGTITAAEFHPDNAKRNQKAARVVLLDGDRYDALVGAGKTALSLADAATDYGTLAPSDPELPAGSWSGRYSFRNLPAGKYRVLAYRTGSRFHVSEPVLLNENGTSTCDLTLPGAEPAGNIIQNPDGTLSYLTQGPDRWQRSGTRWLSSQSGLDNGVSYRCGAVLKDPEATVSFHFARIIGGEPRTLELSPGGAEQVFVCDESGLSVIVEVDTALPLTEATERVWVVPED